jgi:hypothetical protein
MMLNFKGENGKKYFEFCFTGFVLGGSLLQEKGIAVLRLETELFDKLVAISEIKPCGKKLANGEPDRQLVETGGMLALVPKELNMLHSYIASVPWQAGTPTKIAVEVIDWLEQNGHAS